MTLVTFWETERDFHRTREAQSKTDLVTAEAAAEDAVDKLARAQQELQTVRKDIQTLRAKQATATVPSEATEVLEQLTSAGIKLRRLEGRIQDLTADRDAAQERTAELQASLAKTTAGKNAATDSLKKAEEAAKKRQVVTDQLKQAPAKTLHKEVDDLLASDDAKDARKLLDDSLPQDLMDLAELRHEARVTLVRQRLSSPDPFRGGLRDADAADAKIPGEVDRARAALEAADKRAADFLSGAPARFEKARATLRALAERQRQGKPLLTPREKQDAQATTDRTAAATKAEDVVTSFEEVATAERELESALATRLTVDADDLGADVDAKRTTLANKRQAFDQKLADFEASPERKVLDQWQAVVPEAAWGTVVEYLDAKGALLELKTTDPAQLVTDLEQAETALAGVLGPREKAARRKEALAAVLGFREKRAKAAEATRAARVLSAVRGDTY